MEELSKLKQEIEATQVIVFAGGKAKRFGYSNKPKALLPLGSTTLLDHQIEMFEKCGFKRFVLLVGYMGDKVVAHMKSHHRTLDYVVSFDPDVPKVGKGKALKQAIINRSIDVRKRGIIAFPDDVFLDQSLPYRLLSNHVFSARNHGASLTILLVSGRNYPYGVVRETDAHGRALSFEEKPFIPLLTSTGICVVEPDFYALLMKKVDIKSKGAVEFESIVYPEFARTKKMGVMTIPPDVWCSVNDPKEYEVALEAIKNSQKKKGAR
jgi:NDP-sugar pyrophosphorylase family protein